MASKEVTGMVHNLLTPAGDYHFGVPEDIFVSPVHGHHTAHHPLPPTPFLQQQHCAVLCCAMAVLHSAAAVRRSYNKRG